MKLQTTLSRLFIISMGIFVFEVVVLQKLNTNMEDFGWSIGLALLSSILISVGIVFDGGKYED